MDEELLKDEFHNSIVDALKKFSKSADNQDVYAMVLDCDSSVGKEHRRSCHLDEYNKDN